MDEVSLLTASRITVLAVGVAAIAAIVLSLRGRPRRVWVPAAAAVMVVLSTVGPVPFQLAGPPALWHEDVGMLWFVAFPLLLVTFPDGRFVPRWGLAVVGGYAAILLIDRIGDGRLVAQDWWWVVPSSSALLLLAQLQRYRRAATTRDREQVRWLLLGVLVSVGIYMVLTVVDDGVAATGPASEARAGLAILPLLIAVAVAFAAPGVVSVDAALHAVLLTWFVALGLLPVFWGAWWLTEALGTDEVRRGWWWALAVAAFAYPIVRLAIRAADAAVYRGRLSPERAVALLGRRLAEQSDPAAVPGLVEQVAAEALRSPRVVLSEGADAGDRGAPVVYQGEALGALVARPRGGESELTRVDHRVLGALAVHAGPALAGARSLQQLADAHRRLLLASEDERRRLRRDLHDDLGPALSGIALGAEAVALRAEPVDAALAASVRDLQDDIRDAVERARELSHGLRPSVLDDRGLVAAVRDRIAAADDRSLVVEVAADEIATLPAAVEIAALRIVQEAVANVRRHAGATHCAVDLARMEDGLRIRVRDDGIGLPASVRPGVGLRSIRERAGELGGLATIAGGDGGGAAGGAGTLVEVWLPVGAGR